MAFNCIGWSLSNLTISSSRSFLKFKWLVVAFCKCGWWLFLKTYHKRLWWLNNDISFTYIQELGNHLLAKGMKILRFKSIWLVFDFLNNYMLHKKYRPWAHIEQQIVPVNKSYAENFLIKSRNHSFFNFSFKFLPISLFNCVQFVIVHVRHVKSPNK